MNCVVIAGLRLSTPLYPVAPHHQSVGALAPGNAHVGTVVSIGLILLPYFNINNVLL